MKTEFEITFPDVSHDILREKIISLGGVCKQEKTLLKRAVFKKTGEESGSIFFRVRDEGEKITCTYKEVSKGKLDIESVKEIETQVGDFENMRKIFLLTGLKQTAYQETSRELWCIGDEIEFMLDIWPGINPFIEIEGKSREIVEKYVKLLGFTYDSGLFGSVDQIYYHEHKIPHEITNNTAVITFEKPLTAKSAGNIQ